MPPRIRPQTLESFLSTLASPLPPPSKRSPTLRGTLFEYTVQSSLQQSFPGLTLRRIGGAGDGGIDLIGGWELPRPGKRKKVVVDEKVGEAGENGVGRASGASSEGGEKRTISVLVQCKSFSSPSLLGPKTIRELTGTLSNAYFSGLRFEESTEEAEAETGIPDEDAASTSQPISTSTVLSPSPANSLGILAVPFASTKSLEKAILASGEWGIMMVHVRDFDEGGGVVAISWNDKARKVLGGSVAVRNTRGGVKVRVVEDKAD